MVAELFNDVRNIDTMVAKCQQAYANVSDTTKFAMSKAVALSTACGRVTIQPNLLNGS